VGHTAGREKIVQPARHWARYTFAGYKCSSSEHRNGIGSNKTCVQHYKGFCEFYGYLLQPEQQQWACRGCLPVISFGDPRQKFIHWTTGGGTLNGLAFCWWSGCSGELFKTLNRWLSTQL